LLPLVIPVLIILKELEIEVNTMSTDDFLRLVLEQLTNLSHSQKQVSDRLATIEHSQAQVNDQLATIEHSQAQVNSRLEAIERNQSETNAKIDSILVEIKNLKESDVALLDLILNIESRLPPLQAASVQVE